MAAFLLNNEADPNIQDIGGNTALHYAVLNGHCEVFDLLMNNDTVTVKKKNKV